MRVVELALQIAITIAASIMAWRVFGAEAYIAVAVIVASVALALVVARAVRNVVMDADHSPMWFIVSVFLAITLGAIWPTLPIAVTWVDLRRAVRSGDRRTS